jgi:hypothetical protein
LPRWAANGQPSAPTPPAHQPRSRRFSVNKRTPLRPGRFAPGCVWPARDRDVLVRLCSGANYLHVVRAEPIKRVRVKFDLVECAIAAICRRKNRSVAHDSPPSARIMASARLNAFAAFASLHCS